MGSIILFVVAIWAALVLIAVLAEWWDNLNP